MLKSKLSLANVHLGATDAQLHRTKRKAYEARIEECKTLVVQIVSAHLLQMSIPAISNALVILQMGRGRGREN